MKGLARYLNSTAEHALSIVQLCLYLHHPLHHMPAPPLDPPHACTYMCTSSLVGYACGLVWPYTLTVVVLDRDVDGGGEDCDDATARVGQLYV